MPDVKLSQLPSASPATTAAGASLWTHKGHISGLILSRPGVNSVSVSSGSAYIPGLGYAIELPSAVTKGSLSLGNNAWGHVFLFNNGGTADIEVVTTAPGGAYSGTARAKSGDVTRRYLGSVRTDGSGNIYNFLHADGLIKYLENTNTAPFQVLAGGTATTYTTVSCSSVVPISARLIILRAHSDSGVNLRLSIPEAPGVSIEAIPSAGFETFPAALSASQTIQYENNGATTGSGVFLRVRGYYLER